MAMGEEYAGDNYHVAEVINPLTDMLYRFIHTASSAQGVWMDRIVEFDTQATLDTPWDDKESAVIVDIFKVESTIGIHSEPCTGNPGTSNKSQISLLNGLNLNQIRWGMKVVGPDLADPNPNWADGDVTVEDVDYTNNIITLNKPIYDNNIGTGDGKNITFYGDRNLSFGDKDNIKNITGINIIDGMIFWTDNFSEPKKVNIERGKEGSDSYENRKFGRGVEPIDDFNQHTLLVVDNYTPEDCRKNDHACIISGCMDPFANNFNSLATISDLSACTYDPSWDCDPTTNTCSDPGNGTGQYTSLSACETACTVIIGTISSWDCDGGNCIDPGTGFGTYNSLSACEAVCIPCSPNCNWTAPVGYSTSPTPCNTSQTCHEKWATWIARNTGPNSTWVQNGNCDAGLIDIREYVTRCTAFTRGVYSSQFLSNTGINKIWKGTGWSVRPVSSGSYFTLTGGASALALNNYFGSTAFTSSTTQEVWWRWRYSGSSQFTGTFYDVGIVNIPEGGIPPSATPTNPGVAFSSLTPYSPQVPGITFFVYQELIDFCVNFLNIPVPTSWADQTPAALTSAIQSNGSYLGNSVADIEVVANQLELA
tara:strand:+ start:17 stop:1798 length:1782 start_codon:yes stop_codon:yes gene_type:complete